MKFVQLLVFLTAVTSFTSAVASEIVNESDNIKSYCTEQAQLAGIEDNVERDEYIAECVDSYAVPESNKTTTE